MRQVIVKSPQGQGEAVLQIAREHNGTNMVQWSASEGGRNWDVVMAFVSNRSVSGLLEELDGIPETKTTLNPTGIYPMHPPTSQVAEQIEEIERRSSVEVWLNSLQSISEWPGFLLYAVTASVVVWTGLLTNTIYLLVAGMLIAPFAGPAMNAAIATAVGHPVLLRSSLIRYFVGLVTMVVVNALLTWITGLQTATETMISVTSVSSLAVLLPVAAGAAGALNLIEAENSSLVSGTAVGVLVAASLAPPAGATGAALAFQRWDLAVNGIFILALQLIAINVVGSTVFRMYNLTASGVRYERGTQKTYYLSLGLTLAALGGLLFWQFSGRPNLQRTSLEKQARDIIGEIIQNYEYASMVEASVRYTRPGPGEGETLLGVIYVQSEPSSVVSAETISRELRDTIQEQLIREGFEAIPLISVTVLEPPSPPDGAQEGN